MPEIFRQVCFRRLLLLASLLAGVLTGAAGPLRAAPSRRAAASAAYDGLWQAPTGLWQAPAEHLSAYLVLDTSGSMSDNDPDDLRLTAARLFIALLDPGDGAAVITFANDSQVRAPFTVLNRREDRLRLMQALDGIPPDGYTDLRAAIKETLAVQAGDTTSNQKVIILLTDGKPELPNGLPDGYQEETLEMVRQSGLPVLAIGLTPKGQSGFLGRVVQSGAEGSRLIPAADSSQILDAYLGILSQLKDRTVLGSGSLAAPGAAGLGIDPALAPYVQSASFIAVMPPSSQGVLHDPSGQPLEPGLDLFSESFTDIDPRFMVLSLPSPAAGDWQMRFTGRGAVQARLILRSRLRLRVLQPQALAPTGQPLTVAASLIVEDPPQPPIVSIGQGSFSVLVERPDGGRESLDQLYDDGSHGDAAPNDGVFTNQYVNTQLPGAYRLLFSGSKGAVPVAAQAQVELAAFPALQLLQPVEKYLSLRGPLELRAGFQGQPTGQSEDLEAGQLLAVLTGPDGQTPDGQTPGGQTQRLVLQPQPDGSFSTAWQPEQDGPYALRIHAPQALYRGFAYQPEAQAAFEIRRVPGITIWPAHPWQDETQTIDLGIQLGLQDELQIELRAANTGARAEDVQVSIVGLPGAEVIPAVVSAAPGEQTVVLRLRSAAPLPPGLYDQARLVFRAAPGVDLHTPQVNLRLEVAALFIRLQPGELRLNQIFQPGQELVVELQAESSSPLPQALSLVGVEPPGLRVILEPQTLPAAGAGTGSQMLRLRLVFQEPLEPGDYALRVHLAAADPRVSLTPDPVVIQLHVPSLLERFGLLGGGLLFGLVAFTALVYLRIPAPRGTLVTRSAPAGEALRTYVLPGLVTPRKGFDKTVVAGKGRSSDIVLAKGSAAGRHARLRAEKRTVSQAVGSGARRRVRSVRRVVTVLYPLAGNPVRVNAQTVNSSGWPLQRGDMVEIGGYQLEYR